MRYSSRSTVNNLACIKSPALSGNRNGKHLTIYPGDPNSVIGFYLSTGGNSISIFSYLKFFLNFLIKTSLFYRGDIFTVLSIILLSINDVSLSLFYINLFYYFKYLSSSFIIDYKNFIESKILYDSIFSWSLKMLPSYSFFY